MRLEPNEVYDEEPRYKLQWLPAMPSPTDLPIARKCMSAPMPLPRRLALQVTGRTVIRDCCWHHSIDWHQASATAVRLARRLRREHITDREELSMRVNDLTRELSGDRGMAVRLLLWPGTGISVHHEAGHPKEWSYQDGSKRTYAMLEAGVRRTVVIRWVEVPPQ
jgi:hypothetical protein